MEGRVFKTRNEMIELMKDPITVMQEKEIINMLFWSLIKCNQIILIEAYFKKLEKLFPWRKWKTINEFSRTVELSEFLYKEKLEITLEQTAKKVFYILRKISSPGFNFECNEFDENKKHVILGDE